MDPNSLKRRRDETEEEHEQRAPKKYTSHHSHPRTVEESGSLLLGRGSEGTNPAVATPRVQKTAQRSTGGGLEGDSLTAPLHLLCANTEVRIGEVHCTNPANVSRWQHRDRQDSLFTEWHPVLATKAHASKLDTHNGGSAKHPHFDPAATSAGT